MGWVASWKANWTINWKVGFAKKPISVLIPVSGALARYDGSVTPIGAVASWTDQTGNGNAATESTGSMQPICSANQINGKSALNFISANNSKLILPNAINTAITTSKNNTMFFVFKSALTSSTNGNMIISASQGGAGSDLVAISIKANVLTVGFYDGGSYSAKSVAFTDTGSAHVLSVSHAANSMPVCALDGVDMTGSTTPFADTSDGGAIASGTASNTYDYNGLSGEILIYNTVLNSPQISQNTKYLGAKWGITTS